MFMICSCYCFIMLILCFQYKDNSYDSDDNPLSQFVLNSKAEVYEEDEILEDEQEEDKEYYYRTDNEDMCIPV